MELLDIVLSPDLRSHQPQAHLYQAVIQMNEDDIIAVLSDGMIEGDWAKFARMRMAKPLHAPCPRASQCRHRK